MQYVTRYSRKSLRVLGSVGEPINPSAWRLLSIFFLTNYNLISYISEHFDAFFGFSPPGGFTTLLEIQGALSLTLGGKQKRVASWYFNFQ